MGSQSGSFLMDSIYKGYPIGSLIIWRTKEKLQHERKVGPFVLPQPKADFPIDYILDGQQRVPSLFGVFQTELEQESDPDWMNIYFNLVADNRLVVMAKKCIFCIRKSQ